MALTATIIERRSGVPLRTDSVPDTPTLLTITGANQLQVSWSQDSGETASEEVDLQVVFDALENTYIRFVDINWGDSSPVTRVGGFGRSVDIVESHTYTGTGPYDILVEVVTKIPDDLVFDTTIYGFEPEITADWDVDQIKIERVCQEVSQLAVDWTDVSRVNSTFIDNSVRRGNSYKYRVLFRTVDGTGAEETQSQYSGIVSTGPWS